MVTRDLSVPSIQKGDSVWLQYLGQYLTWAGPRGPHPLVRGVCTSSPQVGICPKLGRSSAALGAPVTLQRNRSFNFN